MSNDLISRSAFVKEINEHMKNAYECDIESVSDFQDGNKSEESYIVQGLFEAFELIGNVPTAYDVDKVVEQLEENAKYFQSEADELAQMGNWGTATELQGKAAAYRDAAKTVKSGGIE